MDITEDKNIEQNDAGQHYEVLQELGDCYTFTGNLVKAKSCYEKAASLAPDEAGPHVGLGVVALQKELLADSQAAFGVACRLDRNCSKAYAGLAIVEQQRGDCGQAFEMYLKCLDIDPENLTALLGLLQTCCHTGSYEKIIHHLEEYLNRHPGDTSLMFTLAALYMKDSRFEESKVLLLDILSLDGDNADAANLLEEVERKFVQTKQSEIQVE
jgi:tetratricopeptide (TPR) repeat protein